MRRVSFDLVISDWKMPGMNGLQLFEQIVGMDPAMARRVLFMSGDVVNEAFEDFLRRHGKQCLSKPFELADFRRAVASLTKGNGA